MEASPPRELWRHPNPRVTPMSHFLEAVNAKHGLSLADYPALYQWSIDHIADFWADVWEFVGITASRSYDTVMPTTAMFPRPDFFQGARLNFAENMLFPANTDIKPSSVALVTVTESWDESKPEKIGTPMTWAELRENVRRCAAALRSPTVDLKAGDVVAGFVANHAQAIVAMLAAASVGAVWTSMSPDSGVSAVLDRLVRVKPTVLFADNAMIYNGKVWSGTDKTRQIVDALTDGGSLKAVVVIAAQGVQGEDLGLEPLQSKVPVVEEYSKFLSSAPDKPLHFEQLPPSHPLYILYSSGTTGLPKAIVHTALGTLIQHKKELAIQSGLGPSSRMLYYTTTSWMMWHWSVAALSVGASLVLYTGSPFKPYGHLSMPRLLSALHVTHFGTSAAYLISLETNHVKISGASPPIDLSALEAIYSTASPLPPSTFVYVYDTFPKRVQLASITGGTDIISLFGAPSPLVPVTAGAVQCAGLGMSIAVADSNSPSDAPILLPPGEEGDLVCTKAFPCQPLTFYDGDEKYRAAYFERFDGYWHHGDFVRIDGQSLVMLGRSDGVLKPSGVRFGSAEIYNILTRFFAGEIEDSLCVGRRRPQDTDETVCLFVVTAPGKPAFSDDLRSRIKSVIRKELSPRHVPGIIEDCGGGIPRTSNGKKIEVAVKQILSGRDVKTNASVSNPKALDWFRAWAKSHN